MARVVNCTVISGVFLGCIISFSNSSVLKLAIKLPGRPISTSASTNSSFLGTDTSRALPFMGLNCFASELSLVAVCCKCNTDNRLNVLNQQNGIFYAFTTWIFYLVHTSDLISARRLSYFLPVAEN